MNIAFFSNQFAAASGHGIAHYAHRLYEGLSNLSDLNVIPVATWSNRNSAALAALQVETGLHLLPWGRKLTPLAWVLLNAPPIERWLDLPIDITHMIAPDFPVATRRKLVVTVHDMGPLTHPEYFADSNPWLFRRGIEHAVRYAEAIICVSQATAGELIDYAGGSISDRVRVIHEGVDAEYFARPPIDQAGMTSTFPRRDAPFFLAAGALSPRKNVERLLRAFVEVKSKIPHNLVLVGGGGWDSEGVVELLRSSEMDGRVHHLGYVTDDHLHCLYKQADFYVHPSLFEGFGLTILEAMAAGCPVITSNISALPEVAGDAALLVDPQSIDEIGSAIESMAASETLRENLKVKGLERARRFKWSDTANGVASVYRSI